MFPCDSTKAACFRNQGQSQQWKVTKHLLKYCTRVYSHFNNLSSLASLVWPDCWLTIYKCFHHTVWSNGTALMSKAEVEPPRHFRFVFRVVQMCGNRVSSYVEYRRMYTCTNYEHTEMCCIYISIHPYFYFYDFFLFKYYKPLKANFILRQFKNRQSNSMYLFLTFSRPTSTWCCKYTLMPTHLYL